MKFIFIGYLKTGVWRCSSEPFKATLDPPLHFSSYFRHCMYPFMTAQSIQNNILYLFFRSQFWIFIKENFASLTELLQSPKY